jgi:hypothetical protein
MASAQGQDNSRSVGFLERPVENLSSNGHKIVADAAELA